METIAAYALYPNEVEVAEVVRVLNELGLRNESLCLMFAPTHPIANTLRQANVFGQERPAAAATARYISWLSEFGAVVIPTVGFFIRSQAFLQPLLVARDPLSQCGTARTLEGFGFSDWNAERIEEHLKRARYLVYLTSVDLSGICRVLEVLRLTGAEESATLSNSPSREAVA